jgi:hypothetical protein
LLTSEVAICSQNFASALNLGLQGLVAGFPVDVVDQDGSVLPVIAPEAGELDLQLQLRIFVE